MIVGAIAQDRRKLLAGCLLALAGVMAGCGGSPPSFVPQSEEIVNAFQAKPPAEAAGDPRPALDFYVDSSGSMKGFAAYTGSKYTTVVLSVWHKLTTAQYEVNGYQFAKGFDRLGRNVEAQLISPDFYSGEETHLTELLHRIAEHIRRGEISVVISDMVESQQDLKQMDLVRDLSKLLADRRPEMLLLGFRSGFNGTYYISMGTGGTYPLRLSEGAPGRGRPFYLLVFAPNQASLETLRKYPLTGLGEEASFQPTLPPLVIAEPAFVAAHTPPLFWTRFRKPEPVATDGFSSASIHRLVESASPQAAGSTLEFRFTAEPHVPVLDPRRFTFTVEKVAFQKGKRREKPAAARVVKVSVSPVGKPDGSAFALNFAQLPRPAADSWDVYRVQMRAGKGNLGTPSWVEDWSTPNDQSYRASNRTLYLDVLVESMVRAITENVVFSDHFIALGRGK